MSIIIKNEAEIEKMRIVGRLAADVLDMIAPHVQAGITTLELNDICHDFIVNTQDAIPAPLNYRGFPNLFAPLSIIKFVMAFLAIKN